MKRFSFLILSALTASLLSACTALPKIYTRNEQALLNALEYPDTSKLREALGKKVNPDLCDKEGTPMLMKAAILRNYEGCRLLLEAGADPNLPDADGDVPLHAAAGSLGSDILQLLLKHGAKPDPADKAGLTPLMEAARLGRVDNVRILLDKGASVLAFDKEERSLITFAALAPENGIAIIDLLLKHGFKPPTVIPQHNPLLTALDARHTETAHYLLKLIAGEKINTPEEAVLALAAARLAILNDDLTSVRYLTEMGLPMNLDIATAFKAVRYLNMDGVYKFCVRNGIVETRFPPLVWAAIYARPEIARYLILHGANPDLITDEGRDVYAYANDRRTAEAIRQARKEYLQKNK